LLGETFGSLRAVAGKNEDFDGDVGVEAGAVDMRGLAFSAPRRLSTRK